MTRRQYGIGIPPNPPYQGGQPTGRGDFFLPYNEKNRLISYLPVPVTAMKVVDIFVNDAMTIVEVSA